MEGVLSYFVLRSEPPGGAREPWAQLSARFSISDAEFHACLQDLRRVFRKAGWLAAVLGVSRMTLERWSRREVVSASTRRVVWLYWCLILHPERCRTLMDHVTWGRLHDPKGSPLPAKANKADRDSRPGKDPGAGQDGAED